MINDPHLATVAGWVGKTYAEMEALYPRGRGAAGWEPGPKACWSLARAAFALRGIALPGNEFDVIHGGHARTVFEPEPWDLVLVCNHRLAIPNHVMLYLGGHDSIVVHAIEDGGVIAHPITREPWWSRVLRETPKESHVARCETCGAKRGLLCADLRRGYLRLRG